MQRFVLLEIEIDPLCPICCGSVCPFLQHKEMHNRCKLYDKVLTFQATESGPEGHLPIRRLDQCLIDQLKHEG